MQCRILQNIPCTNMVFLSGNIVPVAVFISNRYGIRVNVHCIRLLRLQQKRGNRKNPAATADIQNHIVLFHVFFNQLHAKLRGFVCPCAEDMSGVNFQNHLIGFLRQLLPGGLNHDFFADREGLEIFLPVVRPILLLHVFHF